MNGKELADALGITAGTLHGWTRLGYLHPQRSSAGKNAHQIYGRQETLVARKMSALVNAGLTPHAAHEVARGVPAAVAALAEACEVAAADREPMWAVGEDVADRAVLDAMDIAAAVRDEDPRDVWARLESWMSREPHRLLSLAVALGAMVDVETPVSQLLAWTESLHNEQEVA